MAERKLHLPQPVANRWERGYSTFWTACGRKQERVAMADEPDEGHATCLVCIDRYHFDDVRGD